MLSFYERKFQPVVSVIDSLAAFIVIGENSIDIVSYNTGQSIGRLIPDLKPGSSIQNEYCLFALSNHSSMHLNALRRSADGWKVVVWDLITAQVTWTTPLPINEDKEILLFESDSIKNEVIAISAQNSSAAFMRLKLENEQVSIVENIELELPVEFSFLKLSLKCTRVNEKKSFLIVNSYQAVICNFKTKYVAMKTFNKADKFIMLESCRKAKIVAIGCANGRIYVLKEINRSPDEWIVSICHWHSEVVGALHFNQEGTVLFSGGTENVLVMWPMNDLQSKTFLSRLPSNICGIFTIQNSENIICFFKDNSLSVMSYSGFKKNHIQLFIKNPLLSERALANYRTVKTSGNMVVANSHAGMLQFCHGPSGKVLMELDVCNFNYVSRTKSELQWNIVAFDLSRTGYLCTLESCTANNSTQTALKFWKFESTQFNMMQSISGINLGKNQPEIINRLSYDDFIVLTDCLSIWRLNESKFQMNLIIAKGNPLPYGLNFSLDGSIMLSCHQNFVQLWGEMQKPKPINHLQLPEKCISGVFGRHSLTAKYCLVSYKNSFEIRDLTQEKFCFKDLSGLSNVSAVEKFPVFIGLSAENRAVAVITGKLANVLTSLKFTCQFFEIGPSVTNGVPLLIENSVESDLENEDFGKDVCWMKNHSLVFVSDNSRFLILSSSRTKEPFSLLHSSDFDTAKESTVSLRDIDNLGSSLSDKLASLKLNKFISKDLSEFSSHLLPKVDSIVEKILLDTYNSEEQNENVKDDTEDKDSGIEGDRLENDDDDEDKLISERRENSEDQKEAELLTKDSLKITFLIDPMAPGSYDI